ncbi:SAP domain-containing protein [uncultured Microbacterium sp.]|uniref:SAP domain-containing protein n=1 Tax=uncultured Microbacterium sp. TaxID=191216 RepID=UPI0025DE54E1|nr:hypothetical protein [uncultured Microbacterium sp.]
MSQLLIHRSPLGPLSIPGVLGEPAPGEPFEVDDDIAETLLEQTELYGRAPAPDVTEKELRRIASDRGIDLTGARNKADIAARIAEHDAPAVVGDTEATEQNNDPQEGGDQQ